MSTPEIVEQNVARREANEQVRVVSITLLIIAALAVLNSAIIYISELYAPLGQLWQIGPILAYGLICLVLWWRNNAQTVRTISIVICLLLFVVYFPLLHLSGGYTNPTTAFPMLFFPVFFVIVLSRRDYLWVMGLFIACFIILAVIETNFPAANMAQDTHSVENAVVNVILAISETLMLNWVMGRLRNARTLAASQVEQLAQLNTELVARQQLQQQTATSVERAAQQLGGAINEQVAGAQEQAAAVLQVSSSAEQLDLEAQLIAGSARQVSELAQQASDEAKSSRDLIERIAAATHVVNSDVSLVVDSTQRLNEQVHEITTIIQLLDSITRETHILSLNAAIEAAAVESTAVGRRFAVVAQEVDELAARAERATAQVRSIIQQIEDAATATTAATLESMNETQRSVTLLQEATSAVRRLSAMAADTNLWADSILQSTEQQKSISDQVAIALRQISSIVRQSATNEQQLQAVSEQLTGLVAGLQKS